MPGRCIVCALPGDYYCKHCQQRARNATWESFLHWADNYALAIDGWPPNISEEDCALCALHDCYDCPLERYGMGCIPWGEETTPYGEVYMALCHGQPTDQPAEVMALCLLFVYYALGGRRTA